MCAISVGGTTGTGCTHLAPSVRPLPLPLSAPFTHSPSFLLYAALLGSFILQSGDTPKRCPGQMTNGAKRGEKERRKKRERGKKEARQNSCSGTLCSGYWQYAKFAICHARRQSLQAQRGRAWPASHLLSLFSTLLSFLSFLLFSLLCLGIYSIRRSTIFMTELRFIASTSGLEMWDKSTSSSPSSSAACGHTLRMSNFQLRFAARHAKLVDRKK